MFSLDHALPPATRILGRTESIGFHAAVARAHGVDEVLLQLCSPSAFEVELVGRGTVRHYPAGARCSPQGDVAEAIHYLQRGKLKLSLVSPRGKEAVIAIVDAEAFFGEGCLAGHRGRTSTATTITACTVVRIHKPAIAEMLHEQLCFADAFIAQAEDASEQAATAIRRLGPELTKAYDLWQQAALLWQPLCEEHGFSIVPRCPLPHKSELAGKTPRPTDMSGRSAGLQLDPT